MIDHIIPGIAFAMFAALSTLSGFTGVKAILSPDWSMWEVFLLLAFAGFMAYGAIAIALGLAR
jgi:hypothetical protein